MSKRNWARMRLVLVGAGLLVAAVFGIATYAQALGEEAEPVSPTVTVTGVSCPTEDSCEIDYRNGAWHVTEVQP